MQLMTPILILEYMNSKKMKSRWLTGFRMLLLGTVPAILVSCGGSGAKEPERYNEIYILSVDLGYSVWGTYGNSFNETPPPRAAGSRRHPVYPMLCGCARV